MKNKKRRRIILLSLIFILTLSLALGFQLFRSDAATAPKNEAKQSSEKRLSKEGIKLNITDPASLQVLVNKNHPLEPQDYRPADLVADVVPTVSSDSSDERSVRAVIRADLEKMFADAKSSGLNLMMNSGFRSSEKQAFYYNNYVRQSGEAAANKFSAKPGYSEHQTGLSLDISYADRKCYLEECFGDSAAGKWLATNSYKYGFILRYPKGKEDITGYQYEPWHFRYAGKELAKEIYEKNLSYEEYLQSLGLL
jgi:D-alanyl-D-alanine carboxypeptidase